MHAIAHEQQRSEPQDPHLGDRQPRREVEQQREREEDREAGEQRPAGPRILEVDVGEHRAERSGHGDGHEVLRRNDVGRQRQASPASPPQLCPRRYGSGNLPLIMPSASAAGRTRGAAQPIPTPHQIRGHAGGSGAQAVWTTPLRAPRAQRFLPRGRERRLMTPDEVADRKPPQQASGDRRHEHRRRPHRDGHQVHRLLDDRQRGACSPMRWKASSTC